MQTLVTVLLWFSAIGCGLMAGLYFAFSAFIMRAFERIDAPHGIAAMKAINVNILRSSFMPLFVGTTLSSAALVVLAIVDRYAPGALSMLVGGIVYVAGMFLCTVVRNVPLNHALARVEPSQVEARDVWSRYLKSWTAWNHVRTVASTVASALFIAALALRSGMP